MHIANTILIGVVLLVAFWFIRFRLSRRRLYKLAAQYDGPRSLPIIGNVLQKLIPLTEITNHILEGVQYYKSPTRLWFGPQLSVQIWDPENAKIVLNSPHALAKEPYMYKLLETVAGRGLATLPVDEWRRHRQLIAPTFKQKVVEGFFDVFNDHSKKLIKAVEDKVDKGIFDVRVYLAAYAMNTLMDAMLDFTGGGDKLHNAEDFYHRLESMFEGFTTRMTTIWYFPDCIYNWSSTSRMFKQDKAKFDGFLDELIKKWKDSSMDNRVEKNKLITQTGSYKPVKLIDHLVSISDGSGKLTSEELHGEVNTIITAGLEGVSTIFGFILILLGMHPDIQDKALQEILDALDNKEHLDYMDLRNMKYLERIIKETLRIFPPVVALGRYAEQEIQLTDHVIPANTSILVVLLALHRDPNIWPNPSRFDPDRFLPEEESKRHPFSWIPFSAGSRNCIGMKFGYMSLKTALSTFLLNYEVATDYTSVEDIKLTMMTVFKPTDGYKIRITRRNAIRR